MESEVSYLPEEKYPYIFSIQWMTCLPKVSA